MVCLISEPPPPLDLVDDVTDSFIFIQSFGRPTGPIFYSWSGALNKHDVKTAQKSAQNVAFLDKEVTPKLEVVLRAKLRRNFLEMKLVWLLLVFKV